MKKKKKNATHRPLSPRPPCSIRTRLQVVHVASLFPDEHQPLQENESGRAEDAKRCSLTSFFFLLPATRSLLLFVLDFRLFRDRSTGQDVELRVWSVVFFFSFDFFLGLLVSTVGRTFGSFDLCCVWQNICRDKSDGNSFHYCLSCYHRPFQYFRSDVTCDTGGVINNSNNYGNNVLFEEKKM